MRWTEAGILDAVEAHYQRAEPCRMLRQVEHAGRRIDGLVVYPGGDRVAVEAKTNRTDFRRETDAKRSASWSLAQRCVYAGPPQALPRAEMPSGWGLLHVHEDVVEVLAHPQHHRAMLDSEQVAGLLLRLAAAEDRLRVPGAPATLSAEVDRLAGLLSTQRAATARETARAEQAAEQVMLARGEDLYCTACDGLLTYTRVHGWRHARKGLDATCDAQRAEAERRRREVLTGAAYVAVEPPRVRPTGRPVDR